MKKNYIARIGFIVYIAFTIPFSLTRNLSPYTYASTQILLAEKNNKEYKEYIEKSFEEIKKGNYKYAIEFASKAIDINPNNDEAYFYRGLAFTSDMNFLSAIPDYSKAIKLNPKSSYFLIRGEAFFKINKKLDSLSDFNKVIEIGSKDTHLSTAHNFIGMIKSDFGDNDNAITSYSKAIELNPKYFEAYNNRAKSKSITSDYYGAIEDLKMMVEINDNSFYPFYALGILYGQYLKKYSKAIFYTEKALKINPNSSDALHNLGYLKQVKGNIKAACANYKKAYDLGSTRSLGFINQLGCY